jgi:HEAT repeat protein
MGSSSTRKEGQRTRYSIRALGRIGDPSSLPLLLSLIKSENVVIRVEAAKALAIYPTNESIDALFAALQDPTAAVSSYAAYSLLVLLPKDRFSLVAEQLGSITSQTARKALYKLLVRLDPQAAIPILMRRTASQDPIERGAIFEAAGLIRSPAVLDLLVHGMADPAGAVVIQVVRALSRVEDPRARRVLLRAIESPRWPIAQAAAKLAADTRLPGAAKTIRERLLNVELPGLVRSSADKLRAEWLLDRTIELEDVKALVGLEKALEVQKDGLFLIKIETAVRQLRAARDAGNSLEKWEALAFDADAKIRETAYRHLGRTTKADAAAEILASAFGRVEPAEGQLVLDQLGELDTGISRDVVERVLTASEYQRPELYSLRDSAAWAARRLGGERMRAALKRSIEIRHGRDIRTIVYYTLLSGKRAIPVIEEWIVPRMRFDAITRGNEYQHLRELLLALRLDHKLDESDRPPAALRFM